MDFKCFHAVTGPGVIWCFLEIGSIRLPVPEKNRWKTCSFQSQKSAENKGEFVLSEQFFDTRFGHHLHQCFFDIPSGGLTYPTLGKGKSSSKVPFCEDMLVSWRLTILRGKWWPTSSFLSQTRIRKGWNLIARSFPKRPMTGGNLSFIAPSKRCRLPTLTNKKIHHPCRVNIPLQWAFGTKKRLKCDYIYIMYIIYIYKFYLHIIKQTFLKTTHRSKQL